MSYCDVISVIFFCDERENICKFVARESLGASLLLGEGGVDGDDDISVNGFNVTFGVQAGQLRRVLHKDLLGIFAEGGNSGLQGLLVVVGTFFGGRGGTF